MTDIDTSMYANLAPKPVNPLENMATIAGIRNTIYQNKLMQLQAKGQEMQNKLTGGQIAVGPHYAASMMPNGQQNTSALISGIASDPDTNFLVPDATRYSREINQPQVVSDKNGQQRFVGGQDFFGQMAPQLSQDKVDQVHGHHDTMEGALKDLRDKPDLSLSDITRTTAELIGSGSVTPQQAAVAFSEIAKRTNGNDSPENLRSFVGGLYDNLQQQKAQFQQQYPKQTPAMPQDGPQQGQDMLAAPPPGVVEAANTAATGAAGAMNAFNSDMQDAPQRIFQREKALEALDKTTTGPGREGRVQAGKTLAALLPEGWAQNIPGVDPQSDQYFDEAKKYMTQAMIGRATGMGGAATADKLAAASSGSPNVTLANATAKDLVRTDIGLERMGMAMQSAWNSSGEPPQNFQKWTADWNKSVEPRAFILNNMTPEERQNLVSTMRPGEIQKLRQTYDNAIQSGVIEEGQ